MSKPHISIGNNIRRLRFDNDEMTQLELAKKIGATRQTISNIESGKYYPSLELAFLISIALNTTLENVFVLKDTD